MSPAPDSSDTVGIGLSRLVLRSIIMDIHRHMHSMQLDLSEVVTMTNTKTYESARDAAIAARDATIPAAYLLPKSAYPLPTNVTTLLETSGILCKPELAILDLSATELAAAIASKEVTSVQATTAYVKAAAIAQQATNCLVELFADEALMQAAELDEELTAKGPRGPLHGVPVSIKDHIDVKGHDSPSGFLSLVGKMVATEDAHMVSVLRDAGAVFYCSE